MNMKALIISLASGVLLAACGGAPEELENTVEPAAVEAPAEPLSSAGAASSQDANGVSAQWTANCVGWDSGGRTCSWKCRSTSEWMWATQSVSYGNCGSYAANFCGYTAYKVCWSSNKPY